jgi:hypothetical protein
MTLGVETNEERCGVRDGVDDVLGLKWDLNRIQTVQIGQLYVYLRRGESIIVLTGRTLELGCCTTP